MSAPFLHSPCEVLRRALIALAADDPTLGPISDPPARPWPLFVGNEPDAPDEVMTLYNTDGTPDGRSMIDGEKYEHPGFQLRLRSLSEETGQAKAHAMRRVMAESVLRLSVTRPVLAGGSATYDLHCCARLGGVISLGLEVGVSKRRLFTVNGVLALRRVS